jgi:thiamine kinase-like enzyme
MHNCPRAELPSQRERLKRKISAAPGLGDETKERLLQMLERLPSGTSVCHGDFHPENVIMSVRGPVVIDWNDVTQGNPSADVARTSLLLRLATPPLSWSRYKRTLIRYAQNTFLYQYEKEYFMRRPAARDSIEVWIPLQAAARLCEEIPGEEERLIALLETVYTAESAEVAEKL